MAINVRLLKLFTVLFLLSASFLWAEESRSFHLAWTEDANVLRYEVVIEKEAEGAYQNILWEFTTGSSIQVSLTPGKYRFYVIPYDYLELPGEASQWLDFEVQPPYIPEPEPIPEPDPVPEPIPEPVKTPRPFSMYLSAAWMPLLPIYFGSQHQNMGESFSPAGAGLRFGVLYTGLNFINTGLEISGSWYTFDGSTSSLQHSVTAGINLVAQKHPLNRRIALSFRLGAGLSFLPSSDEAFSLEKSLYTNIGASIIICISEHVFLETGIDHNNWFTEEPSGCIRPWLGLGWQF